MAAASLSISGALSYIKDNATVSFATTDLTLTPGDHAERVIQTIPLCVDTLLDMGAVSRIGQMAIRAVASASVNLDAPTGNGTTVTGTAGSTHYSYKVVARTNEGAYSAASTVMTELTGNATLDVSHYVTIFWTHVPGADYYEVYRTASAGTPSTTGLIATAQTGFAYSDQGAAGDGSTAPAASGAKLNAPVIAAITNLGSAGSTSYSYKVVAYSDEGGRSLASAVSTTTTGNATLTNSNFNHITWPIVPGADYYKVYRTASAGSPSTLGLIANSRAGYEYADDQGDITTAGYNSNQPADGAAVPNSLLALTPTVSITIDGSVYPGFYTMRLREGEFLIGRWIYGPVHVFAAGLPMLIEATLIEDST